MTSRVSTCRLLARDTLKFIRGHSRLSLSLAIVIAILMHAFLRSSLWPWQHALLRKQTPPLDKIDAIIILGYTVDHDHALVTPPLAARLETAYQLIIHHRIPMNDDQLVIIMSGGCASSKSDDLPSEAAIMAQWFIARWNQQSLPQTEEAIKIIKSQQQQHPIIDTINTSYPHIITEDNSTSTYTNSVNSLNILCHDYPHMTHILLVTNHFHQYRTYATFQHVAISDPSLRCRSYVFGMADIDDDYLDDQVTQWDFWRELAAILYYKCRRFM